tara:strand:+ start:3092 stop:4552 length:1461 start_codon:yes stop_codon:yes gene_type:complete
MKNENLKALIDIGSNTVRLVIYAPPYRFPNVFLNKRFYCDLGRGLDKDKIIPENKIKKLLSSLNIFKDLLNDYKVKSFEILGTAAMREAKNSKIILKETKKIFRKKIKILKPLEEAIMSGYSAISTMNLPNGLSMDLGGGSLDLAKIKYDKIQSVKSLNIGTLRYYSPKNELNIPNIKKDMNDKLNSSNFFTKNNKNIYLIGGAFRHICKKYLSISNNPIEVIHSFTIKKTERSKFIKFLNYEFKFIMEKEYSTLSKREQTIPVAILVLQKILRDNINTNIVFSAYGLREGYNYSKLSNKNKKLDPFVESTKFFSDLDSRNTISSEIFHTLKSLIPKKIKVEDRIIQGICNLSDANWRILSPYRSIQSFLRIARFSWIGINTVERLFVSYTLFNRYNPGKKYRNQIKEYLIVMDKREKVYAELIGNLLKTVYSITSGSKKLIEKKFIYFDQKSISYKLNDNIEDLLQEKELQTLKLNNLLKEALKY